MAKIESHEAHKIYFHSEITVLHFENAASNVCGSSEVLFHVFSYIVIVFIRASMEISYVYLIWCGVCASFPWITSVWCGCLLIRRVRDDTEFILISTFIKLILISGRFAYR